MTGPSHATTDAALQHNELSRGQRWSVWLALLATLAMNAAASILRLNGNTPGSVSDRFQVFFTPAGYVFAIWSLIYLGLLAFAVYQSTARGAAGARIAAITTPFLVSCAANVCWILSWHYEQFPLSMICMLVLLTSLLVIYQRIGDESAPVSVAERLSVRWPLRLYTAWISVATLANLSILVEAEQVRPFGLGAETWAVLMLVLASGVAVLVGVLRRDVVFLGVLAWAFLGIALKNGAGSTMFYAASLALGVVASLVLYTIARSKLWSELPGMKLALAFAYGAQGGSVLARSWSRRRSASV